MTESFDDFAWVPLFETYDQVQMRMIITRLRDQGIPINFHDESLSQTTPVSFGLIARIIIFVPDEYYDRALAILRDLGMVEEEEDDDYGEE